MVKLARQTRRATAAAKSFDPGVPKQEVLDFAPPGDFAPPAPQKG
jgi:hypothetical protein